MQMLQLLWTFSSQLVIQNSFDHFTASMQSSA